MSDDGKQILGAINQIRGLFEEIARLLSTSDALMAEAGWKYLKGTMVTADLSYALSSPRQWMPMYLCRFYQHLNNPAMLPCISVLLGDFDEEKALITEPLVAVSIFDFGEDNKVTDVWAANWCNWHLWVPDRKDDGTVYTVDPRTEWPKDKCPAHRMKSFAWPLLEISDSSVLRAKVVNRLLANI